MKNSLDSKIYSALELKAVCQKWKNSGERVVFTNGCFDILHEGHVRYLTEAKNLGNKLVLGINSDLSVKRLKGIGRPINKENSRAIVLAGLTAVDAIVIFEDDTPLQLINTLLPDILVKGGDWKADAIVGSDTVIANGGKVYSLSFHEGFSTSLIEQKIQNHSK